VAEKLRVAVLISGRGSNMVAISEHKRRDPERPYEMALVASNVPAARGLVAAKRLGTPTWARSHEGMSREEFDAALDEALQAHGVQIVALAGYMRLLSPGFVERWEGRILNVHPSLLPAFPGLDAQHQAFDYGAKVAGCTVHFVDEAVDHGVIILQKTVPVLDEDTPETLSTRILEQEHLAYPEAIARVLSDSYTIEARRYLPRTT
jgi:phosphoribosylglycinamide formyltransferase-1